MFRTMMVPKMKGAVIRVSTYIGSSASRPSVTHITHAPQPQQR